MVGLLFEICIVDASIFIIAIVVGVPGGFVPVGVWAGVVVVSV